MDLRRISDIQHMPILDLESGGILGQVVDWVIQPAQLRVVAYVLNRPTLWRRARIITPADIVEYAPRMIVVHNPTAVISPEEVAGVPLLLQQEMNFMGFRAETEGGKFLGTVADLVIELVSSTISQFHVQLPVMTGGWQEGGILSARQLVRCEGRKLIFPDQVRSEVKSAVRPQTQTN